GARHRVDAVGRDLRRHGPALGIEDESLGVVAAVRLGLAVDPGADIAPYADEAPGGLALHRLAPRLAAEQRQCGERRQRCGARAHLTFTTSPRRTASP